MAGVIFSLLVGAAVVPAFQRVLEFRVRLARRNERNRVPPSLTGHIERLLFTLIVAFDISGAAPAMITWVGVKMAANWNSKEALEEAGVEPTAREVLNRRFSAILTGAVSLVVAVIGGVIAQRKIPLGQPLLWISVVVIALSLVASYGISRKSRKLLQQSGAA